LWQTNLSAGGEHVAHFNRFGPLGGGSANRRDRNDILMVFLWNETITLINIYLWSSYNDSTGRYRCRILGSQYHP
jgi:hypothetical protein